MRELTKKQERVLEFISRFIGKNKFPPSVFEIKENFGFATNTSVMRHLDALERKSKIRRTPKISRGIEVLYQKEKPDTVDIPLLGRIAAGAPILAEENIEKFISIDRSIANSRELFGLKVKGDSMIDSGIRDGDIVIVKKQAYAEDGDIVAAVIEDEATVKRYIRGKNFIKLEPANVNFKPIIMKSDFRIAGKVVALYRKY